MTAQEMLERAQTIARRIASSSSGEALERNITESLLYFPEMTPTVKLLAEPHRAGRHWTTPYGQRYPSQKG